MTAVWADPAVTWADDTATWAGDDPQDNIDRQWQVRLDGSMWRLRGPQE